MTPLRLKMFDTYQRGAVDNETHVVSLNIVEVEEIVKVRDEALGALHAVWANPERGRKIAADAIAKIDALEKAI